MSSIWNRKISDNYNLIWKKWCYEVLPVNHAETELDNEKINFKNIFLDYMRHTTRLDEGSAFKTYSLSPAEMNAMACYRNIIATGNESNFKPTYNNNNNNNNNSNKKMTNSYTLGFQVLN